MSTNNEGITLTIKAKDVSDLREKLILQLSELGVKIADGEIAEKPKVDFPDKIREIYPNCYDNYHSAAMLTVLHERHRGIDNRIPSRDLAKEMKERFPELFHHVPLKRISWGNIFPGNQLEERRLLHIERDKDKRRFYWVE